MTVTGVSLEREVFCRKVFTTVSMLLFNLIVPLHMALSVIGALGGV